MYRRGLLRPAKLDYARPDRVPGDADYCRPRLSAGDWLLLWALLLIGISGFVLEAARLLWLRNELTVWEHRWWSPVGAALAHAAGATEPESAATVRLWVWWLHGLLALVFVAVLPWSKAKHIFTAAASLLVRDERAVQRLPAVDLDAEHIGYAKVDDLQSRHLLQIDACTRCGRCHEACPAMQTGAPLSPRDLVLSLREMTESGAGEVRGDGVHRIRDETLWSCLTCAACVEICPVGVEHVPMIAEMRRSAVEQGELPAPVQTVLQSVHKNGNSFGEAKRKRPAWTRKLEFTIKDARREPVDVLWFLGDFASFDARSQKVSQTFARILNAAGIDFGILYEDEVTAGNDIRRIGEEGLYQHLVEQNVAALVKSRFARIVTTDPHSYNTLKNEYPQFGAAYRVEHASAFLQRLIGEGRIALRKPLQKRVTFHDPCHLGRYNGGYEPPREVLRRLGADVIELSRSRDNSFCCGGGGGRVWQPDAAGRERPSVNRVREVAAVEGLQALVVACPKCMTMLEDATKTTSNEGRFAVQDLVELVAEAMGLESDSASAA
jgi:Fe-S oxidoreductase